MLDDLIARLEKATGPDRALDIAIYKIVRNGRATNHDMLTPEQRESHFAGCAPTYTASIDAALTLLPDDDHHWKAGYSKHVRHNAEVRDLMHPHKGVFVGEHDHSRAIALCIAALKARDALSAQESSAETQHEGRDR